MCHLLRCMLYMQYNFLYSSKLAGYFTAQGFTNFIVVLSSDSSGSLSVESLCTFICYVVKLFTLQSHNLICHGL